MRKESTTSIMRRGFISTLAMCAAMFVSCSSENDIINNSVGENGEQNFEGKGIICTVEQREAVGFDEESRSTLTNSTNGLDFAWESTDKLTVFPNVGDKTKVIYSLTDQRGSDTRAFFDADGFSLVVDGLYYALSKTDGEYGTAPTRECTFPNKTNLKFDFDGQRQTTNSTTATDHLGAYDFMAASGKCVSDNMVNMHFKHLGPTLRVVFQRPTDDGEYAEYKNLHFTEMTMYASDNSFRQPERYLDLTQGLQLDNTYSPKWKDIDRTSAEYINAKPFTLKLGPAPANPEDPETGLQPNSKGNLITHIQIPPDNFTGKDIIFTLKSKEGKEYYSTYTGQEFDPAKVYQLMTTAKKATQFAVTLRVNHLWQHGDEEDKSRATGDPGYDKDITLPTNLYYVLCVDGKVRKVNDIAVNKITSIPGTHWSTETKVEDGKKTSISTYTAGSTHQFVFNVQDVGTDVPKNVYFVASNTDISSCFTRIAENTPETNVQNLVYSIQSPSDQTASQNFLRDLYSTPFVNNGSFTGHLTNVVQDVFLYHVAAKVDLKWNSATMMNTTSPNNEIKVTGVKDTGLSLFRPTTNANGSGSYNVSTGITPGTMYNGRQVYYLPQFSDNKYNVTIGGHDYNSYEFTDVSTEGGYTSWYRALIKQ